MPLWSPILLILITEIMFLIAFGCQVGQFNWHTGDMEVSLKDFAMDFESLESYSHVPSLEHKYNTKRYWHGE
jgi:hypothetical protein